MRTPFIIHRCLIVVSLFTVVFSSPCFIKAECRTNATIVFDKTCTVLCPPNCLTSSFPIWGAGRYLIQSSICRAAIHDVRLNASAKTSFNVTIRRNHAEHVTFHSLVRNEITSIGMTESFVESFLFKNPRISEPVEDITILHKINMNNSPNLTVECYLRGNRADNKPLQMGIVTSGFKSSNRPSKIMGPIGQGFRKRYSMNLSGEKDNNNGIFYCTLQNYISMWSFVTSSSLNIQAHFYPAGFSQTMNVGENINISMVPNNVIQELRPVWFKDNFFLEKYYSNLSYSNVQIGHTGFYSVDYVHQRNIHRGTTKLIVRDCKIDRYGPRCLKTCPPCQNGGVCHDVTGQCICAPGFGGLLCEIGCGYNRFGQNCDASCADLDNEDGCKEVLLCLPDPFGCSCATGFQGLNCSKKCELNHYGANCGEMCSKNCVPKFKCDSFTGKCYNGCKNGYKGETCKISAPYHSVPPEIKFSDYSTLIVTWRPWKYGSDKGTGRVQNYRIEYSEGNEQDIWQEVLVPTEYWNQKYEDIVYHLNVSSDSKITVRIRIQENGIWHQLTSPPADIMPHSEVKRTKGESSKSSTVGIIVGCILAFLIVCIIVIGICLKRHYKKTNEGNSAKDNLNPKNTESVPLMEKQLS